MAISRTNALLVSLIAFAACSGSEHLQAAKVAIVADGQLLFTQADIAEVDSVGLHFTLRDSSVARIAAAWPMGISTPFSSAPRPKRFAVLVDGDTVIIGKMQYIESSYLPEGPLMAWPIFANRVHIFAARNPGIPVAHLTEIRESLRLAGVRMADATHRASDTLGNRTK